MLNDITGIGGVFGAIAKGTESCGSRPICLSGGSGCTQKQEVYNACVSKSLDRDVSKSMNQKQIMILGIAAASIVIIVVVSIIVKNKR